MLGTLITLLFRAGRATPRKQDKKYLLPLCERYPKYF